MRKDKLAVLVLCFALIIAGCNKDQGKSNQSPQVSAKISAADLSKLSFEEKVNLLNNTGHAQNINTRMQRMVFLKDTNNMAPLKIEVPVHYIVKGNSGDSLLIANAKGFIRSSGFPVVGDLPADRKAIMSYATIGMTNTDIQLLKMKMSFEEANTKYKSFLIGNVQNPNIEAFRQNSASLIIRKYLLGKPELNTHLRFYVKELLVSNSQDYPTIYLSLRQLKGSISNEQMTAFIKMIHDNKEAEADRALYSSYRKICLLRASKSTGELSKVFEMQASLLEVPAARANHFIHKIDQIEVAK